MRSSVLSPASRLALLLAAASSAALGAVPQERQGGGAGPSFAADVRPILEGRCLECHDSRLARPKGRLRVDSLEGLLTGGVSGPALVPGDPDASLIVRAVRRTEEWLEMPPEERLPEAEIELLARWVEAGAAWPAGVELRRAARSQPVPQPAREALQLFEREVRPLLAAHCFDCHGPDVERPKSGLRMSGRAALLEGGDSGPALVPGDPDASLLVRAVRYEDPRRQMPPPGQLAPEEIRAIERWVALGAPWPEDGRPAEVPEGGYDLDAERQRWAFRPVARPAVPRVASSEHVSGPIDAFVVARLEEEGLEPGPRATDRELVRRAWADLVGLPPTLEDVEAFEGRARTDPDGAFRALVDELLADRRYGERWARHWLDVVRFAQTNGYERDTEKPFAWRYRDWVVDALNADLPYDQFILHQLAGDELDEVTDASRTATGFYRLGAWDDEPNDPVEADYDELDDVLRTISEGFLGVTMGCARCHDHRFDPFPQEDYYSLLAFVRSIEPYESPRFALDSATHFPLDRSPEALAQWKRDRRDAVEEARRREESLLARGRRRALEARLESLPGDVQVAYHTEPEERSAAQRELLRATSALRPSREDAIDHLRDDELLELRELRTDDASLSESFAGDLPWALVVRDSGTEPQVTRLLRRGRPSSPGKEVEPRFPLVLCPDDDAAQPPPRTAPARPHSTGRRRTLAEWIARPGNPLTARVVVNRVWHHHFGRGIVATPNDFGASGVPPTHPELLDWLAAEFVEQGWSLKWLHREILTSRTWQRSSRVTDSTAAERDPDNALLWRQNLRRLEAEPLRDAILAVCGSLNEQRGGRGFFPRLSRGALAGMSRPGKGWGRSSEHQRSRRSLYAYAKRGMPVPFFTAFDAPPASLPVGARATTTLVTQALTLLNSELVNRQADLLAQRVRAEVGAEPAAQVQRAFERVLARRPSEAEARIATEFLSAQARAFEDAPSELVFQPRVPERVDGDYVVQLEASDLLYGPRAGWRYVRGVWRESYNGTVAWSATDGPAALWDGASFADGTLEARLRIDRGAAVAALLLRARADGDRAAGLELALLPEEGAVELREVGGEEPREVLARAERPLAVETAHDLRVELAGPEVSVHLDGAPCLRTSSAAATAPGALGVRVAPEGVAFETLRLKSGGSSWVVAPDDPGPASQRALASLCLLLLNTDEFAYVD